VREASSAAPLSGLVSVGLAWSENCLFRANDSADFCYYPAWTSGLSARRHGTLDLRRRRSSHSPASFARCRRQHPYSGAFAAFHRDPGFLSRPGTDAALPRPAPDRFLTGTHNFLQKRPKGRYCKGRQSAYTNAMRIVPKRIVRNRALLAVPLAVAFAFTAHAQAPAAAPSPYTSVRGSVTKVDLATKVISVKTDAGTDTTVKFSDLTKLNQLPPGEADTKKATPLKAEEMGPGDHILARVQTKDPTGLPAGFVYINRAADIAKENAAKAQAWQTQAVAGYVESVDVAGKKITMKVKGSAGQPDRDVALDIAGSVNYQRFSDKTFDYENADASAIKTGDHLRVLGSKNADVTEIKVTDVAADAIKQIGATIKSIDPATGQIVATDTAKKSVTITVRPATKVKRLDDPTALMIARIVNPTFQGTGGRGAGRGAGGGGGDGAGAGGGGGRGFGAGGQAGGGAPGGSGFGGRVGGGRGRGGAGQIQNLIDQQPDAKIADLKPGEPIIVSGPSSPDSSSFSAMMVLAGVDQILRAAPSTGADPLGSGWSNVGGGGGGE